MQKECDSSNRAACFECPETGTFANLADCKYYYNCPASNPGTTPVAEAVDCGVDTFYNAMTHVKWRWLFCREKSNFNSF